MSVYAGQVCECGQSLYVFDMGIVFAYLLAHEERFICVCIVLANMPHFAAFVPLQTGIHIYMCSGV